MAAELTAVNHYVPQWYQYQFITDGSKERKYHYLDLNPERIQKSNGGYYFRNQRRFLGPVSCFQQEHLYTLMFGSHASDIIEKRFFGKIDDKGAKAIAFFQEWRLNEQSQEMLHNLVEYLDAQKLRTPKGLDYLKRASRGSKHEETLYLMRQMWQMHVTIWMEGVWEILRCDDSPTKLLVTDHPVTTYNKALFPLSRQCQYPLDAPIACLGTHTLFPLGPTRLLVITNLGYVRNPNANLTKSRENPRSFADTMFDLRKIQTGRQLPEADVIAVNFILKQRARRYIAAEEPEWLYPEHQLKSTMWNKLGDQFFLMPDPRKVSFHTDTFIGFNDGRAWGVDEYGRQPARKDALVKQLRDKEWTTFHKHQKLWDARFGKLSHEDLRKYW